MAGLLADLTVAGKLAVKTLGRRLRSEIDPAPDLEKFNDEMHALLDNAPSGLVRDSTWLTMSGSQVPWVISRMSLDAGDEVTYFISGRAYANRFLDIYVSPALQIWCKLGSEGEIFRGTRDSHSFVARHSGVLQFGNYFPNDWVDLLGNRLQDDNVYASMSGEVKIVTVRWSGTALDGLQKLLENGDVDGRLRSELGRIQQGDTTPEGWQYLWHIGPAEIYRDKHAHDGMPCIHCRTSSDVGILQKAVDLPLDESSEISWRWCVEQLPATLREDTLPSHDYLSIAVEFDNGRDITYYWSCELPVGTGYDCPLPNWQGKEYHVVVRSGQSNLGEWLRERRNLYSDYRKYMGEPPARIVKVWLIANSIFQRKPGECNYADIVMHSRGEETRVL
jgi:hypothetical protein